MYKFKKLLFFVLIFFSLLNTLALAAQTSQFWIKANFPDRGTEVIPVFPTGGTSKNTLQMGTFGFVTVTPSPDKEIEIGNLIFPPNMKAVGNGYYKMPPSKDDSYKLLGSCHTGSKQLIGVLYTVAQAWKKKYPKGSLNIGDLNASGHLSHKNGVDVDLDATSDGKDCVADFAARGLKGSRNCSGGKYDRPKTIELGKMFMGTGAIKLMFYNDAAVRKAVGNKMQQWPNHENHFHVRINTGRLPSKGC